MHKGAIISEDCIFYNAETVKIGDNVTIHCHCVIGDNVVIEDNVTIYNDVAIGPFTHIGANTVIGARTDIGAGILIGNNVKIGGHSLIGACNGPFNPAPKSQKDRNNFIEKGGYGLTICNNVILEAKASVEAGFDESTATFIGDGVVIGFCSEIKMGAYIGEGSVCMPFCYIDTQAKLKGKNKLAAQTIVGGQAELEENVCGMHNCIFKNKTKYKRFTDSRGAFYGFDRNTYVGLDGKPWIVYIHDRRKR